MQTKQSSREVCDMSQKLFFIIATALTTVVLIAGSIIRIPLKPDVEYAPSVNVRGISQEEMLAGNDTDYSGPPTELLPGTIININTATVEELQQLPGIGPALAGAIENYREQNGPFLNIEDIMLVKGIAEGKFSAIRDNITVGDT